MIMERTEFDQLVVDALDEIPAEFGAYLQNVAVVVEDEPAPALMRSLGLDPRRDSLYGVYQGVPLAARSHDFAGHLPDRITIFAGPLLRRFRTPAELRRQVCSTVIHEIAHFFGLDDAHIRRLGY